MYYIVAYRESGKVSQCPIMFPDLESAEYCAAIAAFHFGDGWTIIVEGDDDGTEPELRPSDHLTARDTAAHDPAS
jgi:hypothetical protein